MQIPNILPDKKGPLARTRNPLKPLDPKDPSRVIEPGQYNWQTIVKSRTKINNKKTSRDEIEHLIGLAEEIFADNQRPCFEETALISGFPVILKTNSPHLLNFWSMNWYLGSSGEVATRSVKPITIRAAIGVKENNELRGTAAYYCPENREVVFINTDYYGQCKSWALGAAGVGLSDFKIHSIHGACVQIDGKGILIIAPTGTGKSTYTNQLARYGLINSDDWVYVKRHADGRFIAYPSERYIYVRSNSVRYNPDKGDDLAIVQNEPVMKQQFEIFERSPAENVPLINNKRMYNHTPNSRVMINPAEIAPLIYETPIKVVILLRRDNDNPYEVELSPDEAVRILEKGEFTIQPGVTDDPATWGKLACEAWYNPYLLQPDPEFEKERFKALAEEGGARYVIFNTSSKFATRAKPNGEPDTDYLIKKTTERILSYLK